MMTVDVLSHLWLPGEVKLNYTSRQYFVTMGLYLMTVLLPFETCTTLTFRDLRDITQLENRDLGRHVQQLVDINLVNTTATNVVQLSAAASSAEVNTVSYSVGMTYTSYDLMALYNYIHTYVGLTALCPRLPRWAGTRKVKSIWILLEQETVSGSGISSAICKSAPRSRLITTPAPHHSVFTGRMPFLPPNQQHQNTEGTVALYKCVYYYYRYCATFVVKVFLVQLV